MFVDVDMSTYILMTDWLKQ